MKKDLNVLERMIFVKMLGECNNNVSTMRIVQNSVNNHIGIGQEEYKIFEIKQELDKEGNPTGGLTWNKLGIELRPIEINDVVLGILKAKIKEMDQKKQINFQLFAIIKKVFPELYKELGGEEDGDKTKGDEIPQQQDDTGKQKEIHGRTEQKKE